MLIPILSEEFISRGRGFLQDYIPFSQSCDMRSIVFGLCALGATAKVITSDSHFYGQSPPVYPSRMSLLISQLSRSLLSLISKTANITGTGDWAESYTKAKALVAQLTLEEKVHLQYELSLD